MRPGQKIALLLVIIGILFGTLIIAAKYAHVFARAANDRDETIHAPSPLTDANWPMFRGGPALLGVASGKLSDSLKMYWKFKTGAAVKSSAVVGNGRVYIGSDDGKIYCLKLSDGEKIWSFQTEDSIEAPPTLLDDSVYVGSSDSFLYALDAETGDLKWKYETGAKILGAANWTLSPEGDKTWILVGSYDSILHCVNSVTGQPVWTYETDNYINGSPAVADGRTVFGGCDALIHVVSLADGKQINQVETSAYIAGSAALADGYAYTGNYDGEFFAADVVKGELLWSYDGDGSPFFSSPAVSKKRVVFGSRDKNLYCVSRDKGKPLWAFETLGKVDSSPVICDGKVAVGSADGRLYIVSLSDGKKLWSYEIGESITSSPAVAGGMIIVGSEDGYVYAFGPKN